MYDPNTWPGWAGPVCPFCRKPYTAWTTTLTTTTSAYRPKHRKEGPAQ